MLSEVNPKTKTFHTALSQNVVNSKLYLFLLFIFMLGASAAYYLYSSSNDFRSSCQLMVKE